MADSRAGNVLLSEPWTSRKISRPASGAIQVGRFVTFAAGSSQVTIRGASNNANIPVMIADKDESFGGPSTDEAYAAGQMVHVQLPNSGAEVEVEVEDGTSIADGADVSVGAGGYAVTQSGSNPVVGKALRAVSASGSDEKIEVLIK